MGLEGKFFCSVDAADQEFAKFLNDADNVRHLGKLP